MVLTENLNYQKDAETRANMETSGAWRSFSSLLSLPELPTAFNFS